MELATMIANPVLLLERTCHQGRDTEAEIGEAYFELVGGAV
jgi:hypothetical protein